MQAKELILPENMTGTLAANVFNLVGFDCDLVTPPGITSIGITFNYRGNFKNITLGENITSIGDRVFGGLASDAVNSYILETVTVESETPPSCGKTIFAPQHKTNNFKIYVPDNSLEAYKTTTNLKEYASYMHPISEKA